MQQNTHNGELLKRYLKTNKIRQEDFADKIGISRNYFLTKLKEVEFKDDFKKKVITILELPSDYFDIEESLTDKNAAATPMYNSAATAGEVEVYNDLNSDGPAFYVSIPQFRDCKFGKSVYGHSMYPTITSGCYVFCKPVPIKEHFIPGEIYYIEYDNFGVCKRLQKGTNPDEVLLVSDNDEVQADGTRRYESYVVKIDAIREIFLVKGFFNQNHN